MIIKPFNFLFILLFVIYFSLFFVSNSLLFKASENIRKIFLIAFCVLNIIIYFVYKGFLSIDAEFLQITNQEKFNWFSELPLQLCNINMFLIPIGLLFNKKSILGFSFFLAPIAAFSALIFPEPAFTGFSLFIPRIFGYYITHLNIIFSGLYIASLRFYKPNYKSLSGITVTFVVISLCMHFVNIILVGTVCKNADYFFTLNPAGVSVLEKFWNILPIPYLYLIPALPILFLYMLIICAVTQFIENKSAENTENEILIGKN